MSRTFEGFDEFVAERWPDLYGVALVVAMDAVAARRVTTAAFALLSKHWGEVLDEGRPELTVRRAVLSTSIAACTTAQLDSVLAPGRAPLPQYRPDAAPRSSTDGHLDGVDAVLTAIEVVVRAATPIERALVGAASLWGAGPDEVADLLGMTVVDVRDQAELLRTCLVAAHQAARPHLHRDRMDADLDAALDAVVERLVAGSLDPPDPATLAVQRNQGVRRRAVVAAGAVVAVAGAAAWWGWPHDAPGSVGATRTAPPPPDDISWASLSRWAPRGHLATDPRVQDLVAIRTTGVAPRVLWADDLAGRRLVVSGSRNPGTYEDLVLQAWQGAAGADPASLQEIHFTTRLGYANAAVIPIALPTHPGTLLVVLARPTLTTASYSPTVLPTEAGVIERTWTDLGLASGIGATTWSQEPGPALRVRCGDFDGPAASTAPTWSDQAGAEPLTRFTEGTSRFVAAATGLPVEQVHTHVVTDAPVAPGVIDPAARWPQDGYGRVRVLRTHTSTEALIRCVRVAAGPMCIADGHSTMNSLEIEPPAVLPTGTPADDPVVSRLSDLRPGVNRFLVIAPGAVRVQLLPTSHSAHPPSKVTMTPHGVAIVTVAGEAADLRLVRQDPQGRRLDSLVRNRGRDLLDL